MANRIWTAKQGDDKVLVVRTPFDFKDGCKAAGGRWSSVNQVWIFDATPQAAMDISNSLLLTFQDAGDFSFSAGFLSLLRQHNSFGARDADKLAALSA